MQAFIYEEHVAYTHWDAVWLLGPRPVLPRVAPLPLWHTTHSSWWTHPCSLLPSQLGDTHTSQASSQCRPRQGLHEHDATTNNAEELHFIGLHSYNKIWWVRCAVSKVLAAVCLICWAPWLYCLLASAASWENAHEWFINKLGNTCTKGNKCTYSLYTTLPCGGVSSNEHCLQHNWGSALHRPCVQIYAQTWEPHCGPW